MQYTAKIYNDKPYYSETIKGYTKHSENILVSMQCSLCTKQEQTREFGKYTVTTDKAISITIEEHMKNAHNITIKVISVEEYPNPYTHSYFDIT